MLRAVLKRLLRGLLGLLGLKEEKAASLFASRIESLVSSVSRSRSRESCAAESIDASGLRAALSELQENVC